MSKKQKSMLGAGVREISTGKLGKVCRNSDGTPRGHFYVQFDRERDRRTVRQTEVAYIAATYDAAVAWEIADKRTKAENARKFAAAYPPGSVHHENGLFRAAELDGQLALLLEATPLVERTTLPVNAVPEGAGWRIETGNTFQNAWVRP